MLLFLLFPRASPAEEALTPGDSPAAEELRAAKEQRKKAAYSRIQEIIEGKGKGGAEANTIAPPPPSRSAYRYQPDFSAMKPMVHRAVPTVRRYEPPVVNITPDAESASVSAASPAPEPALLTPPAEVEQTTVAVRVPLPPPPPALAPAATEVALPPLPPNTPWQDVGRKVPVMQPLPRKGVVADRTFILNPLESKSPEVSPAAAPPSAEPAQPPLVIPESPPVAGAQLLPEVAAAMAEALPERAEELSPETEQILDGLPEDIIGRPRPKELPKDVSVDRTDPARALPKADDNKETITSSQSLGMDVAIKQRPVDVDYELEKAYMALIGGNPEEAIALYKSVLDIDPGSIPALFGLATTYHRVGLLDEARPVYGKLLKLDPKNKDAINNFLVLVGEEAPERALEHMKFLENQNPEFAPIPAQMALLYSTLGDMPESIRSMQRAVNISPENLVYKYNLAILYDKAEKPVEASILYRQLLEARYRGENIPADADQIQQRLTFLLSNK